ncbi:hypothetical protein HMI55_006970 [Coelomomyces lativittatus]|nr:hypothetical protein HMI55_006970 [Coelomomyces lativittatus]
MAECVQSEVDLILDFFLDIFAFIPPSTEKRQLDLSSTLLSWYFEKSKLKDDYSIQGSSSSTHSSSPSSTSSSLSLDVPSFFSSLSIPLQSPSSSSLRSESLPSILSDQHTTTTHLSHPSISHGTADVEPLIQPSHLLGRVEVDFNAQEIHERNRNRGMENTLGTTHVTLNASRSLPIPLSHVPLAALQGVRDRQALHEETPSSTHTLSTNDNLDSKLTDVYCVLLWNDDVTSFSDVYSHLKNTLRLGGTVSQRLTVLTDEVGRVVIAETKLLSHAIKLAKTLSRSRLRVTIRPKKDLHREWVAASSLTWLIRTVREEHLGLTTFQRTSLRTMVCQALLQPWQSQLMNTHSLQSFWIHQAEIYVKEIHSIFLSAIQPIRERLKPHATSYTQNRLFGMLMKDIDYWKQLRQTFKELLVSMLLVDSFYKLELARTFAEAYPYLFFHTSLDPEPDHSVLFFSVQLFTSGVVALDLVERGFYFLLLAMLNYETRRTLVKGRMGVIKGLSILCRHLTYILEIPLVQAHLVTHMYHFQIYLKFLSSIHQWYRIVRKTGAFNEF